MRVLSLVNTKPDVEEMQNLQLMVDQIKLSAHAALHPRQILVDRALTHVGAARDLPLAELLLEVQPQDLLNLLMDSRYLGNFDRPSWGRSIITRGYSPAPPFSVLLSFRSLFSLVDHPRPRPGQK